MKYSQENMELFYLTMSKKDNYIMQGKKQLVFGLMLKKMNIDFLIPYITLMIIYLLQ